MSVSSASRIGLGQPFRVSGGLVDRTQELDFSFDGVRYRGYSGDTLASALLANGVRLVGRSFKYHRPRGILSAGSEEPNALVIAGEGARAEPNTRATMLELYDGLVSRSQNNWPSLNFDLKAGIQFLGPAAAAGFYYKTFMWPPSFWEKVYEPIIRKAAGLGPAPSQRDADKYEKFSQFCDVLIVGAGPSGLAAAQTAARSGARVVLCDEDTFVGGRLLSERRLLAGDTAITWCKRVEAELASLTNVTVLTRTTVFGRYDHGVFAALERVSDHFAEPPATSARQRLWQIHARQAVLCTGSTERPLLFGNNDRPGVMLAGAIRTYLNRFAVAAGRRVVVVSHEQDCLRTSADILDRGMEVEGLVIPDGEVSPELRDFSRARGLRIFAGAAVKRVIGGRSVEAIEIAGPQGNIQVECDLVAMSGGWTPNIQLACHCGNKPSWNNESSSFSFPVIEADLQLAGAAAGCFTTSEALASGRDAGARAAVRAGFEGSIPELPEAENSTSVAVIENRRHGSRTKVFIDFQNDVTTSDVELAYREGYKSLEHIKRYTTLGMGTDQGKTANINAIAVVSGLAANPLPAIATTTFRPPISPVALGAFAGQRRGLDLKPIRLTAGHAWAKSQGAIFTEAGLWLRAQYFPREGEDWLTSAVREAACVRQRVGVCDVSTLGKIDVQGPDAAEFLDRVYINTISSLKIGRIRYGVMLREDGFVFDDGTAARLAPDHFVISTTTANAGAVLQHLEFCTQILWPELDVCLTSITEQWAQYAVAGPAAREVLKGVVDAQFDISNDGFPFMAVGEVTVLNGIPARLFRVSFSGELGYELAVPARFGEAVVMNIASAGEKHGIIPYGLESLSIMRIEKGHAAGGELNGQTTARDLGLARMAKKKDFIGRKMSERAALVDPDRPILVGLRPVDSQQRINAGAHFFSVNAVVSSETDEGHMTSVGFSTEFNSWIGLGLVRRGTHRIGEVIRAFDPVRNLDALVRIAPACQFDPEGKKLRV